MRKIISMLLAFSMSLSVMCSSFTVAAIDGNDTAAQTDSSPAEFSSLFSDELNEKAAALSDDYGITSVEVNVSDETAAVSYHAVSDCTVIVGIYEDDGTDTGTHMLTFGTAAVSAENTVGTVAINESLPEYFYVKAYIVEQGTFKPLAKEYTTPNYTKTLQDSLDLTVSDFIEAGYDDDHILNLDGSDSNNFMIFDKRAKILNFDTQISVDELTLTSSALTVKQNADAEPKIANLKKGDPFLFFTTNGVLAGIASSVSYDGSSAVINYTDATTADVFDHIRIDTSDITPRQSVAAYSARSNDRTINVFPIESSFSWTEKMATGSGSIVGASGSLIFSAAIKGNLTISYGSGFKELVAELSVTPTFTVEVTGEGHLGKAIPVGEATVPIVGGAGVVTIVGLKFAITINPNITVKASAKASFSTTMTAKADTNKDLGDMMSFDVNTNSPELRFNGTASVKFDISFSAGLAVAEIDLGNDEKKALFNLDLVASVIPNAEVSKSEILGDSKKHLCKPLECFDGKMGVDLKISLVEKSPVLKAFYSHASGTQNTPLGTLSWGSDKVTLDMLSRNIWPEERKKFNIKLDPFSISWGECDNYAYRTYFDVEDELTGDKLEKIFVYTEDASGTKYSEDTTNRGGRAVLYLKPNESFKIGFRDTEYTYNNEDKYFTVTEPDEKFTVKMTVGVPPTYIEPRPAETEEVPTFFLSEKLRYNKLMVKYDERTYYIDFTDDMIKSFDPNTLGEQTLVIEYNGKTWSHKIKIIEDNRELQSVFLSPVPAKKEYKTGESLDLGNAKLNAVYKNVNTGETETDKNIEITSDMISGFDTSTEGEKEVTVTFTDAKGRTASTSFNITVVEENRTVESIKIKTPPNKIEYAVGEALDITGLTIDVNFTDGTSSAGVSVSSSNVTGFDSDTPGIQTLTVTYTDKYGNEATASFKVKVGSGDEVTGIEIQQLLTPNKYCQINGSLNLKNALIKVTYANGMSDLIQITEDMISGFDSSTLGTFPATVTYGQCQTTYDVEVVKNLKKVCRIELTNADLTFNIWQDDLLVDGCYVNETGSTVDFWGYQVIEYFLDGSNAFFEVKINSDGSTTRGYYDGMTFWGDDSFGGKIKIEDFDINKIGIQEIKITYCNADGTPNPDVEPISTWRAVHAGKSFNGLYTDPPSLGDVGWIDTSKPNLPGATSDYNIGESFDRSRYYVKYYTYRTSQNWGYSPYIYISDDSGNGIKDDAGNYIIDSSYLLSNPKFQYIGGFDSRYPSRKYANGGFAYKTAYFEYKGFVIPILYKVLALEATLASSETAADAYNLAENMQYADYSDYDDMEYDTPIVTEAPAETETPDNTEQETTEPVVTEPVVTDTEVTDTTVTEPQPEETTVTETASAEETPVFGNDSSGMFGFGRSGRKTAQYANLHKNDIYNYYVVRNASADILGRDNLLFVGQTSSDSMGSLSFEYETTTGEDGTVILRPMSDDPTTPDKPATPDTPSNPTTPDNGGSSPNTAVIPVNATVTKTMTIKVENKVTGETSKARGQKKGSSVTVKLGTENDGCYANVYTTDDEYICSAIIENGRAKFNVSNDVKLKIVIDSFAYGEDVSTAAGAYGDSAAENLPYAAITIVIAIVGIYFKKRSEKKVK